MDFWKKFKKPVFILAPMDGVTDTVFRQIVGQVGKPDVFFTEFVPVDAIVSPAREKVIENSLRFSESERPIVAQIWGIDPEKFFESAKILAKLGFDGIDINMGCPTHDVIKKGACSALIKNPDLAKKIILATIKGANGLPISVKTRIGFESTDQMEDWVTSLLKTPISALTLHLRTVREQSKVSAHWELIEKVAKIRNELKLNTLIIGNGDVKTLKEAKDKCNKYGIDGVMIGRGIFENVYLFNNATRFKKRRDEIASDYEAVDPEKVTPNIKIALLLDHLKLFKKTFGDKRHFELMKKFVKCYVNNFDGASEKREKLMRTKSLNELMEEVAFLT